MRGPWPAASSRSTIGWLRRDPHTIAGASGRSVSASHATTVSPSLSRPTAATSPSSCAVRSPSARSTVATVSSASFSIQPGWGWLTCAGW